MAATPRLVKHDKKHHFRSSGSGILRTSGEAAKQYSNLKQRAKGKLSESKGPKTGGGPKPPSPTPVELSILEQLEGRPSLEGICGRIDTAEFLDLDKVFVAGAL